VNLEDFFGLSIACLQNIFGIYFFTLEEYNMMWMNILPCGNFLNMDETWKWMKYGLKDGKE
jgi:hypothetical protein